VKISSIGKKSFKMTLFPKVSRGKHPKKTWLVYAPYKFGIEFLRPKNGSVDFVY
jgi:hypothetical protein